MGSNLFNQELSVCHILIIKLYLWNSWRKEDATAIKPLTSKSKCHHLTLQCLCAHSLRSVLEFSCELRIMWTFFSLFSNCGDCLKDSILFFFHSLPQRSVFFSSVHADVVKPTFCPCLRLLDRWAQAQNFHSFFYSSVSFHLVFALPGNCSIKLSGLVITSMLF